MRWKILGVVAAFVGMTNFARADRLYSINDGTPQPVTITGQTASITLPAPVNGQVLLRVWSTQPTTEDMPALTISGTVGTNAELRVMIADPSPTNQFPETNPGVLIVEGLNNLAGLSFSNTALRDASRLVVAINGSVTGPIDAGQLFRIQARTGTTATGAITAHAADNFAGFRAMEVVTTSEGSLLGDVLAPNGSIGSVTAPNGPIGPAPGTQGPTISAANIGTVQAQTINATINATGTLNFLNATTGGMHGIVHADLYGSLLPSQGFAIVSLGASTARFEGQDIRGDVLVGALTGASSGIVLSGDFHGEFQCLGLCQTFDVGGDVCGSLDCSTGVGEKLIAATGGFGLLRTGGSLGSPGDEGGVKVLTPRIETLWVGGNFSGNIVADPDGNPVQCGVATVGGSLVQPVLSGANLISLSSLANGVPPYRLRIHGEIGDGYEVILSGIHLAVGDGIQGSVSMVRLGHLGCNIINANGSPLTPSTPYYWHPAVAFLVAYEDFSIELFERTATGFYDQLTSIGYFIGEAPFAVHAVASDFWNHAESTGDNPTHPLLASEFNAQQACTPYPASGRPARVVFYGPLKILPQGSSTRAPVSVEFGAWADTNGDNLPDIQLWSEVSDRLDFSVDPANSLILRIKPVSGWVFPAGTYRVQTWTNTAHQRLACDELLTTADVPVRAMRADATPSTAYYFTVLADCDPVDCAPDCPTDTTQLCCGLPLPGFLCDSIDFNNDGLFPDTLDLDDFLSVFQGGPCSSGDCNDLDFNNDGLFPDTLDHEALLSVFGGGPCLW
jgi:hypothetical protein